MLVGVLVVEFVPDLVLLLYSVDPDQFVQVNNAGLGGLIDRQFGDDFMETFSGFIKLHETNNMSLPPFWRFTFASH